MIEGSGRRGKPPRSRGPQPSIDHSIDLWRPMRQVPTGCRLDTTPRFPGFLDQFARSVLTSSPWITSSAMNGLNRENTVRSVGPRSLRDSRAP